MQTTKIQQQHRTNLVISETIRKSLNMLVFSSGLCTKCSYQQKQTCFCWEEKLTQWSITATRNTVQGFWVTIGGSNLFQQREGKAAPSLANLWLERASHLCTFPLIPQLTKHCAVSVSDMLCLSGHLDMHLVSQGVCLSVAVPDGRALITVSYVSKSRAANADFWGSFDVSEGLCCVECTEWNAD